MVGIGMTRDPHVDWYVETFCEPLGHRHDDDACLRSCILRTLAVVQGIIDKERRFKRQVAAEAA